MRGASYARVLAVIVCLCVYLSVKAHTKFEVCTITCNEEMKGNAKILILSHPLGT